MVHAKYVKKIGLNVKTRLSSKMQNSKILFQIVRIMVEFANNSRVNRF